ncbi:hypothetical protein FOCC_FOCC011381, partial [Frankliniella occidentalis]
MILLSYARALVVCGALAGYFVVLGPLLIFFYFFFLTFLHISNSSCLPRFVVCRARHTRGGHYAESPRLPPPPPPPPRARVWRSSLPLFDVYVCVCVCVCVCVRVCVCVCVLHVDIPPVTHIRRVVATAAATPPGGASRVSWKSLSPI